MSKKRGMSKQQRLYYEYQNRDKVRQELFEFVKQERSTEKNSLQKSYNPHESSYFT
jgi:hypothetical protein